MTQRPLQSSRTKKIEKPKIIGVSNTTIHYALVTSMSTYQKMTTTMTMTWLLSLAMVSMLGGGGVLGASDCCMYLAPSSIPGSGLGMYAGNREFKTDEIVTLGDVVIPIVEMDWNNGHERYTFLWEEYTWDAGVFPDMEAEVDDWDLVNVASPGVGAAANSYLSLVNIYDTEVPAHRVLKSDSPGAGATSPYQGRKFYASKDITPGTEIFVSYGATYFVTRPSTYGYIPMPKDYKRADRLLKRYVIVKNKLANKLPKTKYSKVCEGLWELLKTQPSVWKESRALNALPSNSSDVTRILISGGTSQQHFNDSIKDLNWLEENGICMDNIRDGISTIPDAGMGAFATRQIKKGDVVAPAPLIQVEDGVNILKMYTPTLMGADELVHRDFSKPQHYQLLLNYCFGHSESTLLLCPYGLLTGLINHSKDKPNARIEWGKEMRHKEWLEQPIEDWTGIHHTGLAINFVALRDIDEGEEILIDYGDEWEQAWQEHVKQFKPRETYYPATELNEMMELEIRTIKERPYELDGVRLFCRSWYIQRYRGSSSDEDTVTDEDLPCNVLKRMENGRYMVQIMTVEDYEKDAFTAYAHDSVLWDVPRDAFYFQDITYTADYMQFWAFRHAMMIPDDIFPSVWKNKKDTK